MAGPSLTRSAPPVPPPAVSYDIPADLPALMPAPAVASAPRPESAPPPVPAPRPVEMPAIVLGPPPPYRPVAGPTRAPRPRMVIAPQPPAAEIIAGMDPRIVELIGPPPPYRPLLQAAAGDEPVLSPDLRRSRLTRGRAAVDQPETNSAPVAGENQPPPSRTEVETVISPPEAEAISRLVRRERSREALSGSMVTIAPVARNRTLLRDVGIVGALGVVLIVSGLVLERRQLMRRFPALTPIYAALHLTAGEDETRIRR